MTNDKAEIRLMSETDREFWFSLDRHLPEEEFMNKVERGQGYVCLADGIPVGLLRYNLFWDNTPFCTMLYIDERCQGQGFGRLLMTRWERDMKARGYGIALTSTQVNEAAQHFYRKLGYRDCGCLVIDVKGYEQPMEMFMIKEL